MQIRNLIGLLVFVISGVVISCGDPAADEANKIAQELEDSLNVAVIDKELIDDYIADPANGMSAYDTSFVTEEAVRIFIKKPESETGKTPKVNDLVSNHYIGKFLDDVVFDTSKEALAFNTDSLSWTKKGIDFTADTITHASDTLVATDLSTEKIMYWLSATDDPLFYTLFNDLKAFRPILYNHTEDGRRISSGFIVGFRVGMREYMNSPYTELNSKAVIFIPSAVGYGVNGTKRLIDRDGNGDPEEEYVIPPNTPLIFELDLVNIRP
jgi:FKBP-type peptidyl-prolyl cis-trans isomerase